MADPLSPFDPFMTAIRHQADFDRRDEAAELAQAVLRDDLIAGLLQGQEHLDTVLDCLAEQGIDPDGWVDQVEQNISYVIDAGVRFEPTETGLFLPTAQLRG